jgi:hypothetical protein
LDSGKPGFVLEYEMASRVRQVLQIFHGRMGNLKQLATEHDHHAHEHIRRRLKPQSPLNPDTLRPVRPPPLLSLVDSARARPFCYAKFYSKYNSF